MPHPGRQAPGGGCFTPDRRGRATVTTGVTATAADTRTPVPRPCRTPALQWAQRADCGPTDGTPPT